MNSYGFPSMLQYSRLNTSIADTKAKAEAARIEVVTGRIADLEAELGGSVGDAQLLRKAISDVELMQAATQRSLGRAQIAQVALTRSTDGVETNATNMLSAIGRNDEQSINIAATQAGLQLDAAISAFNTRYEGRSLFSGDATNQPSLADAETLLTDIRAIFAAAPDAATREADLDTYFNDPAGGFATNIYLGGDGLAPRTEISEGELINYSAKADEQAVKDLLRGLSTAVIANENTTWPDREQALTRAAAGMIEATEDLVTIRARVGAAEERMVAADTRLEAEATALGATYNERTARDPYEAASMLQQLESQLDASYLVTARISQLSFVNYVR
ncbi:flagellin [Hyphococcus sp. DH-69]|uniref:flagellin n=1 Tax=Hyphococcus formosus TaxID=3143534 RepID=UPI00398A80FE